VEAERALKSLAGDKANLAAIAEASDVLDLETLAPDDTEVHEQDVVGAQVAHSAGLESQGD